MVFKMPTNRPFFTNFFSAFRARSSPTYQAKSNPSSAISPTSLVSTAHVSTTATNATSTTKTITTKSGTESQAHQTVSSPSKPTSTALPFSSTPSHRYAPPLSRSPGTSSPVHNQNLSMSPPGTSTPLTRGRQRRGSDSSNSSGGFMDGLGAEKWYIGGRTAGGEETFYRLGLVSGGAGKRVRSLDRLSL